MRVHIPRTGTIFREYDGSKEAVYAFVAKTTFLASKVPRWVEMV
jgi:hypothetical protein